MANISGCSILSLIVIYIAGLFGEGLDMVYIGGTSFGNDVGADAYEDANPANLARMSLFYLGSINRGAFSGLGALKPIVKLWAGGIDELESISEIWDKNYYNKPFFAYSKNRLTIAKGGFGVMVGFDAMAFTEINSSPLLLPEFTVEMENRAWAGLAYGLGIKNLKLGAQVKLENRTKIDEHRHFTELQDFRPGDLNQKDNYSLSLTLGSNLKLYIFEFELICKNLLYQKIWGNLNEKYKPFLSAGVSWTAYSGFPPYILKLKTSFEIYDITNTMETSWKRKPRIFVEYLALKDKLRLLAGLIDGYPSFGIKFVSAPICLSYSMTTFERAYEPGQSPFTTHNIQIAITAQNEQK